MQNNMKVIGLTGGIASGKSTVASILAQMGAYIIDADKIGHGIYDKHTPVYQDIIDAFGCEVLDADGNIDRSKLAGIVFNDKQKLSLLNAITHPAIKQEVLKRLDKAKKAGFKIAVVEAALLIEAGWDKIVDEVWLVVADENLRLHRLMKRSGISEHDAVKRIKSQASDEEMKKYADVIIVNNGDMTSLKNAVEEALHRGHI